MNRLLSYVLVACCGLLFSVAVTAGQQVTVKTSPEGTIILAKHKHHHKYHHKKYYKHKRYHHKRHYYPHHYRYGYPYDYRSGYYYHGRHYRDKNWEWVAYGAIPLTAIILSSKHGKTVYACKAKYRGVMYRGTVRKGEPCYINYKGRVIGIKRYMIMTR